jgi:hypothetical protein
MARRGGTTARRGGTAARRGRRAPRRVPAPFRLESLADGRHQASRWFLGALGLLRLRELGNDLPRTILVDFEKIEKAVHEAYFDFGDTSAMFSLG